MPDAVPGKLSQSLPDDIHKGMICTPARFIGEYEDGGIMVKHAWPMDTVGTAIRFGQKSPASIHYFIVAFKARAEEDASASWRLPEYTAFLGAITDFISVFFGKKFNSCGMIESGGLYHVPRLPSSLTAYHDHYPYNDLPRPDLGIELNLTQCGQILRIFTDDVPRSKIGRLAFTAVKFYARALRTYEHDHGSAFIDLMMAGEIISKYKELEEDERYDDDLKMLFARLSKAKVPESDIRLLKSRLFQVKRHFVQNLMGLLNEIFFQKTECTGKSMPIEHVSLQASDIKKRIGAAYDLRSRYVHTGIPLDSLMTPWGRDELPWGHPNTGDEGLDKIAGNAPTFYGMERIIRFCLLRLVHKHVLTLHPDLD